MRAVLPGRTGLRVALDRYIPGCEQFLHFVTVCGKEECAYWQAGASGLQYKLGVGELVWCGVDATQMLS